MPPWSLANHAHCRHPVRYVQAFRDLLNGQEPEVNEEDYEIVEYVLAEEGDDVTVPLKPLPKKAPPGAGKSPEGGSRRRSTEERRSSTERRSDADAWVLGGQQPPEASAQPQPRHARHAHRSQRRASDQEAPSDEHYEPAHYRPPGGRSPHSPSSQARAQRQGMQSPSSSSSRYAPPPAMDEEATASMRAEGSNTKKRIVYNAAERQAGHSPKAAGRTRRKRRTQDDEAQVELHARDSATGDLDIGQPLDGSLKEEELI